MLLSAGVVLVLLSLCGAVRSGGSEEGSRHQGPVLYDAYFARPVTAKRQEYLSSVVNGSALCTVRVEPCNAHEGRRTDGTCINHKYPSRGATITPFLRLLPPMFGVGSSLRPAKDGTELPSTRVIRTTLLADGFIANHDFSHFLSHYIVNIVGDSVDLFYLLRYVTVSGCCLNNQIPNEANPECIPIKVPDDDPYLRRTNIRCLNLTRVETYQDYGCIPRSLPAERYNRVTPVLDLSTIYGFTAERAKEIRANEGGLLAFMMEGDREVPAGQAPWCVNNKPPLERTCYNFGDSYQANSVSGGVLSSLLLFREHNRLARKLAIINECWDDEKLYRTARQINIAQYQYNVYYEMFPELLGYNNLRKDHVIYDTHGYVNDFDSGYKPGVYREFILALRWFHTALSGFNDLYRNHKYQGSRRQVDDIFRSGIYNINNTEAEMTQGALIQREDDFDHVFDPDISERIFGGLQAAADLPATDMMRGRDAGLPPYNHYRKLCGMKVAETFEDFRDHIPGDKVEKLRRLYEDVDEVELMVAIYSEKLLPNAYVGPTLYCILTRNLLNWRKSDMYFFEHGEFPAAFTIDQLNEIRKSSVARQICDNGVNVKMIQPRALFRKKSWNPLTPCDELPEVDLYKWKDHCPSSEYEDLKK